MGDSLHIVCAGLTSYGAFIDDSEARTKRGERQVWCSECGFKWKWPEQCGHPDALTEQQFDEMAEAAALDAEAWMTRDRSKDSTRRTTDGPR